MLVLMLVMTILLSSVVTQAQAGYCVDGQCQCTHYLWDNGYPNFKGAGNAYQWWDGAPGKGHGRGNKPIIGAVLVWKKDKLPYGHVALTASISVGGDDRKITVNHANWPEDGYRRYGVIVTDVSLNNNWTSVKVGSEGTAHDTYGFIYPLCYRSSAICTMKRVGDIAWYPAISDCTKASQRYLVTKDTNGEFITIGSAPKSSCPAYCPAN